MYDNYTRLCIVMDIDMSAIRRVYQPPQWKLIWKNGRSESRLMVIKPLNLVLRIEILCFHRLWNLHVQVHYPSRVSRRYQST